MPYLNVSYDDPFRYCWNEVVPAEWFLWGSIRSCTEAQLAELKQLQTAYERTQELLKEIIQQPEIEGELR